MIEKTVVLACAPARAFELFTEHASSWWPESRRHLADPGSQIRMQPAGRFWEQASDGREVDLGRITVWDPPRRLVADFYVGTDPQHPTEVTVLFDATEAGTRVTVKHGPKPVSTEPYAKRAPQFARSWDALLEGLAAHAATCNA